jgi:hypothetical protein
MDWQPIESAPTNERIIVSESSEPPRDEIAIAWLDIIDGKFFYAPQGGLLSWAPTHWMPLPPLPEPTANSDL